MKKREEGSALAMTLITLVVVSILAMALMFVSSSEYKISVKGRNKTKAYYFARSGAEIIAAAIEDNSIDLSGLGAEGDENREFSVKIGEMDDYKIYVNVTKADDEKISIESVSEIGGIATSKGKATLILNVDGSSGRQWID